MIYVSLIKPNNAGTSTVYIDPIRHTHGHREAVALVNELIGTGKVYEPGTYIVANPTDYGLLAHHVTVTEVTQPNLVAS